MQARIWSALYFFRRAPRNIGYDTARALAARVAGRATKVSLTVDADDATLAALIEALHPDLLQLHGRETPARVAAIREKFGLPVMKALGVSTAAALAAIALYEPLVDRILFDAKPPADATRPGGNGLAFDWRLIGDAPIRKPWMLSGGLDAENVAEAIRVTEAPGIDVSSGVESSPGVKDLDKIKNFVAAARLAYAKQ